MGEERANIREEKSSFWARVMRKLKDLKEEFERDSVAKVNYKVVDCCHPPEEIFNRKK
ncbi:MAG: hypothetical protein ACUVXI_02185 [bacterium]